MNRESPSSEEPVTCAEARQLMLGHAKNAEDAQRLQIFMHVSKCRECANVAMKMFLREHFPNEPLPPDNELFTS